MRDGPDLWLVDYGQVKQSEELGQVSTGEWPLDVASLAAPWPTCVTQCIGCTYTLEYWKNHNCEAKENQNKFTVADVLDETSVWLGDEEGEYSTKIKDCEEAEGIFDGVQGRHVPRDMLKAQLLVAKLNIENGASATDIQPTIDDVDSWLADNPDDDGPDVDMWIDLLDFYNNGIIGPGHCDNQEEEE